MKAWTVINPAPVKNKKKMAGLFKVRCAINKREPWIELRIPELPPVCSFTGGW
jgi:hypothetical protein